MSTISTILSTLRSAVWAIDVRDEIANAIEQCYKDVNSPSLVTDGIEEVIGDMVDNGRISGAIVEDLGLITEGTSNLFDFTTVTAGRLNTSTGEVGEASGYWTSDYIAVESGKTYYFANTDRRVAYNSSKVYSANISGTTWTASADGYIRVSVTSANRKTAKINEGSAKDYRPGRSPIDFNLRDDVYRKAEVDAALAAVTIATDPELETAGAAADAKATGDAISELNESLDALCEVDERLLLDKTSDSGNMTSYNYYYRIYTADSEKLLSKIVVKGESGNAPKLALVRSVNGTPTVVRTTVLKENNGTPVTSDIWFHVLEGDELFIGGYRGAAYFVSNNTYSSSRIDAASLDVGDTVSTSAVNNVYFTVALYYSVSGLEKIKSDMGTLSSKVDSATGGYDSELSRNYKFGTRVDSNGLVAVLNYPEVHTEGFALTLDSIAYENLTYRDIFITNNVTPDFDFEDGMPSIASVNKGAPVISSEVSSSGSKSLYCSATGDGSCNVKIATNIRMVPTTTDGRSVYILYRCRVDRYVSGDVGPYGSTVPFCNEITDGFVTVAYKRNPSGNGMHLYAVLGGYLGVTGASANADAYFDDIVVIGTGLFQTDPTVEEITSLYNTYISIKNDGLPEKTVELAIPTEEAETEYTDEQSYNAFIAAMNTKATAIGMSNSTFANASGTSSSSRTTAKDLCKLASYACGYTDIFRIWNKKTASMVSEGGRNVTVSTTVHDADLEASYYIIGGKTGTLSGAQNIALVVECSDGTWLAGAVMDSAAGGTRWADIKKMFDIAMGAISEALSVTSGCCAKVPRSPWSYEGVELNYLYSQSADTQIIPASTSKLMAAVTALDYLDDLSEKMTCKANTSYWTAGDVITYRDCLLSMMLPSDNNSAENLAYSVGRLILKKEL